MVAPAFGTIGTQLENTVATVSVDVPDSVASGDIVVVSMFVDGTATVTAMPTGFAQAPDSPVEVFIAGGGGAHRLYVMWKRATGADNTASTYDFTLSGSSFVSAAAARYTGAVATGDPWDVTASAESGATNVTASPAVSDVTTVVDTLLIHAASNWGGGTPWTPSSGFAERRDLSFGHVTVGDKVQAAAGATGSVSATSTASNKSGAWLGALKSVVGGGGGSSSDSTLDIIQAKLSTFYGVAENVGALLRRYRFDNGLMEWEDYVAHVSSASSSAHKLDDERQFWIDFSGGSGQSAVALAPIDGEEITGGIQSNFAGNGFYARNGFTRARDWTGPNPLGGTFNGWDDLDFLPINVWLADFTGTGFYTRMADLGLTGMLPAAGSVDLDNNVSNGVWGFVADDDHAGGTITGSQDPGMLGAIVGHEPSTIPEFDQIVTDRNTWQASSDGPGRITHAIFTDAILNGDIGGTYTPADMATVTDMITCDQYWFAGAPNDAGSSLFKLHFRMYQGLAGSATTAQCARGSHYGSMMDTIRKAFPSTVAPFGVWVENGGPYTEPASAEITPAQMQWAVWSTIVHGARGIYYFNHTFRELDPGNGVNNFNNNYYGGPGVAGTGIYAKAKEINRRALQIAHVINSPFDGYFVYSDQDTEGAISTPGFLTAVTSTNARAPYAGVDAHCKWEPNEHKHYILATTREAGSATNIPVTFRMVDQGQTSAVRVFAGGSIAIQRGGAIPVGFCEFSDTFATAADYHVYRIDN